MLAIKDQLAGNLENFVGDPDHSHRRIFRTLFEIGANRVERVADKHGLDEPQLIVAVAESVNIIVSHQAQANAEYHRPGYQALAENSFFFGKLFVRDVRVHVENERVEGHALALRDGPADRTGAEAHFKILVEPDFLIPDFDLSVLGWVGIWVRHVR